MPSIAYEATSIVWRFVALVVRLMSFVGMTALMLMPVAIPVGFVLWKARRTHADVTADCPNADQH